MFKKRKMEENFMEKVVEFLQENPVQYLATVGRDGKAKCRPFMFAGQMDGKLWFCTNNTKDVYKDMQENPEIEISVSSPSYAWIRLHGTAVFENNMAVKEVCEDIKDAIKEEFDVSDEDIKVAMELLGLTALDLLSTAKVAELIEQLTGTDALTLITNEDMMQSFNNIINVVDEANADIAGMLGVKTEEVGIVLGQNDIAPVVNSEDTAKQDNVKESDAKNADDNINQTVDNQESLSEVLAKKITTESDGKAKNNMSESNEANNKVTYADVADNMISNITDTFADIITEDISTVKEADIVNQVIDSVKLMASRELTSMEVMLNPEHLGSVHITVTARNGIVSAQIAAQNEQVKTALENQMVTLREQFESQGLKVDAVEITVMAHSFEAGQNFGQSESERKQGESKVHRKLDLSSFDDELEEDLESTAPAPKAEGSSVEYLA